MIKARHIGQLGVLFFIGWFSWGAYSYFFDRSKPVIQVKNVADKGSYKGEVSCVFSSNKKSYITLLCDETVVFEDAYVSTSGDGYAHIFDTTQFADGKHLLRVISTDRTFTRNRATQEYDILIDNTPLEVVFIDSPHTKKIDQGKTLCLQFETNKSLEKASIKVFSDSYTPVKESKNSLLYECFIPIDCQEQPNMYTVQLECYDKVGNCKKIEKEFEVVAYPFKKEVLAINQSKIEEEKEIGKHPQEFKEKMIEISQNSPQEKLWKGSFCTPIDVQRVTCEFGTIRTTQHKGRYMHRALDVINTPKSVVWATQDGVIALKDRFADTGNTVVIDHGCGITSLFFHLDDFAEIEVGQKVAQGNPIGKIGKTGYATGYHLHWEMRVNNIAVDPMQWTKA